MTDTTNAITIRSKKADIINHIIARNEVADSIGVDYEMAAPQLSKLTKAELIDHLVITVEPTIKRLIGEAQAKQIAEDTAQIAASKKAIAAQAAAQAAPKSVAPVTTQPQMDVNKVKAALIKAGFKLNNKTKVYTDKKGVNVRFTAKQAQFSYKTQQQSINFADATTGSFVKCLQHLRSQGTVLKHVKQSTVAPVKVAPIQSTVVKTEDTTMAQAQAVPTGTANTTKEPLQGVKQDAPTKAQQAKDAAKAKAAIVPVAPKNPNADGSTPIFDQLSSAFQVSVKADESQKVAWEPIAVAFEYSIKGLTEALHAEGQWPAKLDKNGKILHRDGITIPRGYQKVVEEEKESGIVGIGNYVNRAARMFSKLKGKVEGTANDSNNKGNNPTELTDTKGEVDENKVMVELERLMKKLKPETLKSFIEASPVLIPILAELNKTNSDLDSLAGIGEESDVDALADAL